jgi:hypothetical protein
MAAAAAFLPRGVLGKDLGSSSAFFPSSGCSSSTGFCKSVIRRRHDLLVGAGVGTVSGRSFGGLITKSVLASQHACVRYRSLGPAALRVRGVADDGVAPG